MCVYVWVARVCAYTCELVEARGWLWPSSSVVFYFILGEEVSYWIGRSLANQAGQEGPGICLSLPPRTAASGEPVNTLLHQDFTWPEGSEPRSLGLFSNSLGSHPQFTSKVPTPCFSLERYRRILKGLPPLLPGSLWLKHNSKEKGFIQEVILMLIRPTLVPWFSSPSTQPSCHCSRGCCYSEKLRWDWVGWMWRQSQDLEPRAVTFVIEWLS